MSDLISRQATIEAIRASASKYTGFMEMEMYTDDDAVEAIASVPSVDAEPVKHGRWIRTTKADYAWECSACGYGLCDNRTTYCYDCGARMDGKR